MSLPSFRICGFGACRRGLRWMTADKIGGDKMSGDKMSGDKTVPESSDLKEKQS